MYPAYAEINRLLGQSENDKQLVILSKVIREHLPAIDQNEDFSNISKLWERRNNTWSTQLQTYLKERNPPIYSQQDIAAMNNSFNVMVAQCNKEREDSVKNYIKLLDETRHRSKQSSHDLARFETESRADIDAERCKQQALKNKIDSGIFPLDNTILHNESKQREFCALARKDDFVLYIQAVQQSCKLSETELRQRIKNVQYLTPSKGEKHWLLSSAEGLHGWVPHLSEYQPVCTNKPPVMSDLVRLTELCPYTQSFNLALTIKNFIEHGDTIGWSNKLLIQALLEMLKKYKPDLYSKLNVKRAQTQAFFQSLVLNCNQQAAITSCRDYLSKFVRGPSMSFVEAITAIDSVYAFWQQLLRPVSKQELNDMTCSTLRQITPFLLHDKCAKLFSSWCEQQNLYQTPVTRESIIDVVQKFEQNRELQITDRKKLPAHLGFGETFSTETPTFQTETTEAKFAEQKPSFQQRSSSREYNKLRSDSQTRTPASTSKERTGSQHHQKERQRSRSPGPQTLRNRNGPSPQRSTQSPKKHPSDRQQSRSRSPGHQSRQSSRASSRGSAQSSRDSSTSSQYKDLERHSSLSNSSKRHEVKAIPSMYRSKSPGTVQSLRKHYFNPGKDSDRFKTWRQDKRCLRCFSDQHVARNCDVYLASTPEPCRMCVWLYHPSEKCVRYHLDASVKKYQKN